VRPLRVALVHAHAWPEVRRGAERYLADLATTLAELGHDVTCIVGTGGPSGTSVDGGITTVRLRHRLSRTLTPRGINAADSFGARCFPHLLRHRYDVVHAMVPSAALAAVTARQRTVYTVLGHPTREQFVRRVDLPLTRAAMRRSHVVTALSGASADACADLGGRRPRVLAPGVRIERFPAELAARTGPLRMLFNGDASDPRKGVDLAIQVLAALLPTQPDARLVLGGPGDHRWALGELPVGALAAVDGRIDVLGVGALGDVAGRYRSATLTLHPARHEAFGLVLLESLASGTPVVCADDGGMPDIVTDDGVGRVVQRTPAAVLDGVRAVVALAADPATPQRCAAHARRWSWSDVAGPAHAEVYRQLVGERG
jgi:glycosyltransferase involved in cell wall biosynthesis